MDRFVQRSKPGNSPRQRSNRQPLAVASSNSARQQQDEPPSKKRKVTPKNEIRDSDAEPSNDGDSDIDGSVRRFDTSNATGEDGEVVETSLRRVTEIESSLPSIEAGKDAIAEYQALRASQIEEEEARENASKAEGPKWVRGKSSIYVDAFNLALDTVLEDETHLFDDKERKVFELWRALDYEAQYLYLPCTSFAGPQDMC